MKTVQPLAEENGLQDVVVEHTDRIPYSQTLRCLLDADALIVPGSDDPGYTASKIYPYLLANKPCLAIFERRSSVCDLIVQCGGAILARFGAGDASENLADVIDKQWLTGNAWRHVRPLDHDAFLPHTANHQAKAISDFFRHVLDRDRQLFGDVRGAN